MRVRCAGAALVLFAGVILSACASGEPTAAPRPTAIEVALPPDQTLARVVALLATNNIPVASTLRDARVVTTARIVVPNRGGASPFTCTFSDDRSNVPYECLDFSVQYQFFIQAKDAGTTRMVTRLSVVALDSIGLPRGEIGDPGLIQKAMARLDPVFAALSRP
jgi:hypothetical protein